MYRIDKDILVFQSSMWQTNSVVYLNEAAIIVIDPTYFPVEIKVIANAVQKQKSFKRYLIFTHSDFDHIVGYQYFRDFKLVGHRAFEKVNREEQLEQLIELDETYYIRRDKEFIFPELDTSIDKDAELILANDRLILIHAPGHTEDGLFIISISKRLLISGDYLSDLEFPFVYYSLEEYLKTLQKARRLVDEYSIETVIPGHGDFAVGQKDIYYRIDTDIAYLEELLTRVGEYCSRGLSPEETMEVLKEMSFRGEKITGAFVKLHMENIKRAIGEVTGIELGDAPLIRAEEEE